ncbi:HAMP domain-containing sensor histidine kinase [Caballeronia mineralivorans]|uniref:sensor histidine kinase n=1 Tax=Caballeronia mineralivorans TaxID=2010198 RepID=UPI0023F41F01|nr:HAMP domain-containing sensor histidine kinase [Caballeronia mineralivorans]MDB5783115.1 histidine kinase [Caballeronia mineralivorans]
MLLIGFIGYAVTGQMERRADVVIQWQLVYFGSLPDNTLADILQSRVEHEHMHINYYGLFAADGRHMAGDVLMLPPGLSVERRGMTLEHTLSVAGVKQAPVVRAMAVRRRDGTILVVAHDLTQILTIRLDIINALIGGGIFCLVTGFAVGLAFGVRQMRRVKAIHRVTVQIAQGDLNQRLPTGGHDELDLLSNLVNHMLDEVERLMTEVKGACDGIAHDLLMPLAHVRTLLVHVEERADTLNDEQLPNMVARARSNTDKLLERFRAMLRISEIGALQRRGGFADVQLATLLSEVGELYEPLAESKSIKLVVQIEPVGAIHADRALLFEAFSNLVDNAIKFAPTCGTVCITLTRMPFGPQVDIVDNGPGIPSGERQAVLKQFYRSEQTRHIAGSGLGLSMVSAVIRVHDFTIRIGNAEPGTRVTIECWS